jgi:valyl-tRNA synthetase
MHLHGKSAINPLTRDILPIILDETVDMKFQTGYLI